MKRITLIIIAFFALTAFAQPSQLSIENFAPLESQGAFPVPLKTAWSWRCSNRAESSTAPR